jgi:hypothetical protein
VFGIEEAAEALEEAAHRVDVDALDGTRALRLVELLARAERAVAGARTVVTRRVEETRAWQRTGHRTMAEWLAATTGSTLGVAIGSIETARSLPELPATEAAFRSGEISEAQARAVTAAATESPDVEASLLDTAKTQTVKTLRQRCRAVIAAAIVEADERERDARIHRERCLRRWLDRDGALCLSGRMTADAGARLFATIDAHVERLAKRAANDGVIERDEAFAADALVALADPGERTPAAKPCGPARLSASGSTATTPTTSSSTTSWRSPTEATPRSTSSPTSATGTPPLPPAHHPEDEARLRRAHLLPHSLRLDHHRPTQRPHPHPTPTATRRHPRPTVTHATRGSDLSSLESSTHEVHNATPARLPRAHRLTVSSQRQTGLSSGSATSPANAKPRPSRNSVEGWARARCAPRRWLRRRRTPARSSARRPGARVLDGAATVRSSSRSRSGRLGAAP